MLQEHLNLFCVSRVDLNDSNFKNFTQFVPLKFLYPFDIGNWELYTWNLWRIEKRKIVQIMEWKFNTENCPWSCHFKDFSSLYDKMTSWSLKWKRCQSHFFAEFHQNLLHRAFVFPVHKIWNEIFISLHLFAQFFFYFDSTFSAQTAVVGVFCA